jgi:hypothetical protein
MNFLKRIKNRVRSHGWWLFVGLCLGITPYMFRIADAQRGYDATGGEIFVPFIPLLVWAIKDSIKEMKGVFKND